MRWSPILEKLYWLSLFVFVMTVTVFPIQSEDLFMYLALARDFFQHGKFATSDPFVYPVIQYWTILHQWLSYFIFYGAYEAGGYNAIIAFKVIFIGAVLGLPLIWAYKNAQASFMWGLSVLIGVMAMSFRLMERTSMFSDAMIVAVIAILANEIQRPSRIKYLLPVLFLVWVNLHPGFPTGWALCGMALFVRLRHWRSKDFRILLGLTAASVLICLVNPRGLDGVLYPFVFSQNEGAMFRKLYFEWFPTMDPLFFWNWQSAYILGIIGLNLVLIYKTWRTKPYFEILASVFMITYGLYAIRFVTTMCYALILLNVLFALRLKAFPKVFRFAKPMLMIVLLTLSVKNVIWGYDVISGHRNIGWELDEKVLPVKGADLVKRTMFIGNVFNSHMFGGYLAWVWGDQRKIFYHGFVTDTKFYLSDYIGFFRGRESFDALVKKYEITAFLLDRFQGSEPLLKTLAEHPNWKLGYIDDSTLIFILK